MKTLVQDIRCVLLESRLSIMNFDVHKRLFSTSGHSPTTLQMSLTHVDLHNRSLFVGYRFPLNGKE